MNKGVGVGLTRDTSTFMVGQYFKRRRELVDIFLVSGSGIGLSFMSLILKGAMKEIGWRLGLQAVTGLISTTFILGKGLYQPTQLTKMLLCRPFLPVSQSLPPSEKS